MTEKERCCRERLSTRALWTPSGLTAMKVRSVDICGEDERVSLSIVHVVSTDHCNHIHSQSLSTLHNPSHPSPSLDAGSHGAAPCNDDACKASTEEPCIQRETSSPIEGDHEPRTRDLGPMAHILVSNGTPKSSQTPQSETLISPINIDPDERFCAGWKISKMTAKVVTNVDHRTTEGSHVMNGRR